MRTCGVNVSSGFAANTLENTHLLLNLDHARTVTMAQEIEMERESGERDGRVHRGFLEGGYEETCELLIRFRRYQKELTGDQRPRKRLSHAHISEPSCGRRGTEVLGC